MDGFIKMKQRISYAKTDKKSIKEREIKLQKHLKKLNKIKKVKEKILDIRKRYTGNSKGCIGRSLRYNRRKEIEPDFMEKHRIQERNWRKKRKKLGLCLWCDRKVKDGHVYCLKHRKRINERSKEYKERKKNEV